MRLRLHAPYFSTFMSSHLPICIATLSQKNRTLNYRPLYGEMNPPHITRYSLSRGGIKIELGRAVEIELKGITASGGSGNILWLFLSQKRLQYRVSHDQQLDLLVLLGGVYIKNLVPAQVSYRGPLDFVSG